MILRAFCLAFVVAILQSCGEKSEPVPQAQPPSITSISPILGAAETPVTINGANFGTTATGVSVTVNGVVAEITSITNEKIVAKVAPHSGTGAVEVTTAVGSDSGPVFNYLYTVTVTTLAGSGTPGTANGTGSAASFNFPGGIALAASGDLFVGDRLNNTIRKVTTAGVVSLYSGSTIGGTNGDISVATYYYPNSIAFDNSGNMYVSETAGNRIRKITSAGIVSTLAGDGTSGLLDGNGTSAQFGFPVGIALDGGGNVYVAEFNNCTVRKITPGGDVTTLAGTGTPGYADGTGTAAQFGNPSGIAIDTQGNLYVTELGNNRIRKITPAGVVTTYAGDGNIGSSNGQRLVAQFYAPRDLVFDDRGNLIVVDGGNNQIRLIEPGGYVVTLAGTGTAGFADGSGTTATFNLPYAVERSGEGEIIVGERTNAALRKIVYY
jgi:sugar lactone lactonase YvrE